MLTYTFDETLHLPLYEQLYRMIRKDMLEGRLKAGDKLPSKRAFARHLGISTITVENAYAQLQVEGYLYAVPRQGYFIADLGVNYTGTVSPADDQIAVGCDPGESGRFSPAAKHRNAEAGREWLVDFTSNRMQTGSFPFETWAKLSRVILSSRQEDLMTNPPSEGTLELREALSDYLEQFRGLSASPDQILIGPGTEYLYGMLIQLLGYDQIYACEDPGYSRVRQIFEANRVPCRFVPLDGSGIRTDVLEECGASIVHVTPSHHFPTGITMPAARRFELLSWADRRNGRWILEDDYDSELRMSGKALPSLFSMDARGHTIYMNTFTRTMSSTIRISYMILPVELAGRFRDTLGFYSSAVPTFEQFTMAAFIRQGYLEKQINRLRFSYRKKRDYFLCCLRESALNGSICIYQEQAGTHFLMKIRTDKTELQLQKDLSCQGIRLARLRDYFAESAEKQKSEFESSKEETEQDPEPGSGNVPGKAPEKQSEKPFVKRADQSGAVRSILSWEGSEHVYVVNYVSVPYEKMQECIQRLEKAVLG